MRSLGDETLIPLRVFFTRFCKNPIPWYIYDKLNATYSSLRVIRVHCNIWKCYKNHQYARSSTIRARFPPCPRDYHFLIYVLRSSLHQMNIWWFYLVGTFNPIKISNQIFHVHSDTHQVFVRLSYDLTRWISGYSNSLRPSVDYCSHHV